MNAILKYIRNAPTWYTLVWCLYFLQGTLYSEEGIFAKLLLIFFLLLSLFYSFKLINLKTNKYIGAIAALAIMFGIYGLIRIVLGSGGSWVYINDSTTYFKEYELSILPIFAFYYFSITNQVDEDWFVKTSFVFLSVAIALFYREQTRRLANTWRDDVTNNMGYYFVALLPYVLLLKRWPLVQFSFLSIVLVFIIQSMKRGAILVGIIALLILLPNVLKSIHGRQRIWVFLLTVMVTVAGSYYISAVSMKNDYFMFRVQQTVAGDASNREIMYPEFFNYYFANYSFSQKLIGGGADSTLRYLGGFAHNDWLELLLNEGLLGILIYFIYWIRSVKYIFNNIKFVPVHITTILKLIVVTCFVRSFFSMSTNDVPIFMTSIWGYAIARKDVILRSV